MHFSNMHEMMLFPFIKNETIRQYQYSIQEWEALFSELLESKLYLYNYVFYYFLF